MMMAFAFAEVGLSWLLWNTCSASEYEEIINMLVYCCILLMVALAATDAML